MTYPLAADRPIVIRRFIDPDIIKQVRDFVEVVYHDTAIRIAHGGETADRIAANVWGGSSFSHIHERYPHLYGREIGPLIAAVETTWPGYMVAEGFSCFRQIREDRSTYIYWHADADGTGSHKLGDVWNCWLPLADVGITYNKPSLEIICGSDEIMRKMPMDTSGHRTDYWVDNNFRGKERVCPILHLGDALIFSHWLLHRTQPMEELIGDRIGAEIRFTEMK